MPELKPMTYAEARKVVDAIAALRTARDLLAGSGSDRAADAVRRAIKSAEGAKRHADRRASEAVASIIYDMEAAEQSSREERGGQSIQVAGYFEAGQPLQRATVCDPEGKPIYWADGFVTKVDALLWGFHSEGIAIPHNAAQLLGGYDLDVGAINTQF